MSVVSRMPVLTVPLIALALANPVAVSAQEWQPTQDEVLTTVHGSRLSDGPDIEGVITNRNDEMMQVTTREGQKLVVSFDNQTEIRASGGFLGMKNKKLGPDALYSGMPVDVETVHYGKGLIATKIKFKNDDLKMASIVHNGTAHQFAEHGSLIRKNAATADALRSRMGDIDKYNIKGTANVYFDSGKYALSAEGEQNLCAVAAEADAMENALLLVVGYTDSTGSYEVNQALSEKRAGRVVNYLQQACGWKPWRMMSPTGMATADPAADNSTAEGKAQNRRVAVNILVSKSLEGM
ncbi:OmpA family protein [Croceicoccus naphthovorans]|uniref:OmpA family protein n=1 Tax=Croceicoccus naphthovorans TaxID=1348774 RepID=A0A0G3XKW8_9SPHN|nr:OmpA family protein [Croceicoccus naphthovorans]AKM11234.1 OmpA family protein [Croceicoccus naphthovorans]MBB3989861.1 outer membrane protein OmpA-like peptidoglycan-associated protein [Croceicoccus naphthovorans]